MYELNCLLAGKYILLVFRAKLTNSAFELNMTLGICLLVAAWMTGLAAIMSDYPN